MILSWRIFYWTTGLLYLVVFCLYLLFTVKSFRSTLLKPPGASAAQVSFTVAVLCKSAGSIWSGFSVNSTSWCFTSIISEGLPGYATAVAYSLVFFSWYSILGIYFIQNSSVYFDTFRKWIVILCTLFISLYASDLVILGMSYNDSSKQNIFKNAKAAEGVIAAVRDTILFFSLAFFFWKLVGLFDHGCFCGFENPSNRLVTLCFILVVAMGVRFISIIVYNFAPPSFVGINSKYFAVNLVEQLFSEMMPIFCIWFMRDTSAIAPVV